MASSTTLGAVPILNIHPLDAQAFAELAAFPRRQPTPNAKRIPHPNRKVEALRLHRAQRADFLRKVDCFHSAFAFVGVELSDGHLGAQGVEPPILVGEVLA
jgi:hypothetical protein